MLEENPQRAIIWIGRLLGRAWKYLVCAHVRGQGHEALATEVTAEQVARRMTETSRPGARVPHGGSAFSGP